jgi:hypothetical protein
MLLIEPVQNKVIDRIVQPIAIEYSGHLQAFRCQVGPIPEIVGCIRSYSPAQNQIVTVPAHNLVAPVRA